MSAADFLPAQRDLPHLIRAADHCEGCPLYRDATQTVFGRGPVGARLMMVGEQPGDQEDRKGLPFVGPAGRVLDEALDDLGIARDEVYVTNAVKHFKWTQQGKRRLHAKPSAREMNACHPWLEAEIEAIGPRVIVCLGATAVQSMLGSKFRITRERGKLIDSDGRPPVLATYHPSAILRAPEKSDRDRMRAEFADDLRVALKASRSRSKSRHAAR
ncbi:MAG TPA: UdgX family uracil-DNA binding protein [Pirellulales bacterium]|jgi:DNA polymerase|nr:UdgX family uracil-DNA binding protein [Pirellulales bacterium]